MSVDFAPKPDSRWLILAATYPRARHLFDEAVAGFDKSEVKRVRMSPPPSVELANGATIQALVSRTSSPRGYRLDGVLLDSEAREPLLTDALRPCLKPTAEILAVS